MDYSSAQKLMLLYDRIGTAIREADGIIRTLPEAQRLEHLRGLAGMVDHLWSGLQLPIVREHPDLDPDADYFKVKKWTNDTAHVRQAAARQPFCVVAKVVFHFGWISIRLVN